MMLQLRGFDEVLGLYTDLCRRWLRTVIKIPVASVLKEPTVEFSFEPPRPSIASKLLGSMLPHNQKRAESDMVQHIMKIKVRVRTLFEMLLATTGSEQEEHRMPLPLVAFVPRYLSGCGTFFPCVRSSVRHMYPFANTPVDHSMDETRPFLLPSEMV